MGREGRGEKEEEGMEIKVKRGVREEGHVRGREGTREGSTEGKREKRKEEEEEGKQRGSGGWRESRKKDDHGYREEKRTR